ncbi:MAG: hypothetical protein A3G34_11985 [Candidatus Lindowbacteria bacterium RIFCSPLOWO2_12_FULL_62_27]|nr:MAG: hypothetical protein A3I06_07250 [Candidatus Lindowbacteria bacterium RIFCSPLOWO2_02_FULL_62_12]OGH61094.1 MAG: hypothetical protein A3G34_11985 [Candidatus Lindowbacteria bacterium RIFCSPLOWO2_12_FULL_62_27]
MKRLTISLKFQERYGGKFVAMKGQRVLASGRTYGALERKLARLKLTGEDIEIMHVSRPDVICVY